MFNMMNMMGKLKEIQKKMDEVQDNLSRLHAFGEAGAGMVKVTVTGKRQVISVEIDPSILQPKDQQMVQDLIVAAANKALDAAGGNGKRRSPQVHRRTAQYSRPRPFKFLPMTETAVVVLNYNGKKFFEKFLPPLVSFTPAAEIFVADNGSTDDSISYLSKNFPTVKIIDNQSNLGFCGGYNKALKQVNARYYVLLNSDVEVTPHWSSATRNSGHS